MKKKRILIIVYWLVFLILAGTLLVLFEYHAYKKKAVDNLTEQTNSILEELPQIAKNDAYAQIDYSTMHSAKLDSLLLALQNVHSLNRANSIAEQFYLTAGIKGLAFYDENGKILSTIGDYTPTEFQNESIDVLADTYTEDVYDVMDEIMDFYMENLFTSDASAVNDSSNILLKKSGPWIIGIEYDYTKEEETTLNYFRWQSSLNRIQLPDSAYILVLDKNDGTVLSGPDEEMNGQSLDKLSIRSGNSKDNLSPDDLNTIFRDPNKITKLSISGKPCYAMRMDLDTCLMLAVLPVRDIRTGTVSASSTWLFLLALVTGICMLFSLFYLDEKDSQIIEGKGRYNYNRSLSGRLSVCTVLALVAVIVLGFFLEVLSVNADIFHYNQLKAKEASKILSEELSVREKLENMYKEDELFKARIGGIIIRNNNKADLTTEFMEQLAKNLNIKYCYYYDLHGNLVVSNSPYAVNLNPSSEFYSLLKGRAEYAKGFEYDETVEEYLLKAGVSVFDENDKCIGALIIEDNADRRTSLLEALDYDSVLREADLSNKTCLMILTGEENKIRYFIRMTDGQPHVLFEDGESTAAELGMDESKLRDEYNGTISVNNMKYFASVERTGDNCTLIMQEKMFLPVLSFWHVLFEAGAVLLFMILLLPMACLRDKKIRTDEGKKDVRPETIHVSDIEADDENNGKKNEVLAVLSGIANKNKPYFEERWAKDSTKWADKSSFEKFSTVFVIVCFFAILSIILQALFMKENSIWFYCLSGEWDKGINLHSIVSCIITVCILFYGKIIIHKLLYLTARASSARGETACHLFDSFLVLIMYIMGILICLANFGVDIKILGVTGGVTGLIISFSCQTILADMLAGILITIEGSVKTGDFVTFNGEPGIVYSIGIHTTKLKWYGEITSIRNNDFRNFVSFGTDRVKVYLKFDYRESLSRFEDVFEKETPYLHEKLCEYAQEYINGPNYLGITEIGENGVTACFSFFCPGEKIYAVTRMFNRELLFMCERNNIPIAMPQVVINEPKEKVVYEKKETPKKQ